MTGDEHGRRVTGMGLQYWSQRDRRRRQSNQPAVARVRLVDGVSVIMTQLVDNLLDSIKVLREKAFPHQTLEPAAFDLATTTSRR